MSPTEKITDVSFIPVTPRAGLLGFMSCIYDGDVSLSNIAVKIKLDGTLFLLCPSRVFKGKRLTYFHPINNETYTAMVEAIRPLVQQYLEEGING